MHVRFIVMRRLVNVVWKSYSTRRDIVGFTTGREVSSDCTSHSVRNRHPVLNTFGAESMSTRSQFVKITLKQVLTNGTNIMIFVPWYECTHVVTQP